MEAGGVAASGQWVEHDGDGVFASLEAVGGVDVDPLQAGVGAQQVLEVSGLVAVGGADGDVARFKRLSSGVVFAVGGGFADQQALRDADRGVGCLRVDAAGVSGG